MELLIAWDFCARAAPPKIIAPRHLNFLLRSPLPGISYDRLLVQTSMPTPLIIATATVSMVSGLAALHADVRSNYRAWRR